jgi:putative holliday junction resolvase
MIQHRFARPQETRALAAHASAALYSPPTNPKLTEQQDKQPRPDPRTAEAPGRLLALDLGTRRVGVAVSDELRVSVRPLRPLPRESWKKLLRQIDELCRRFDAAGVVVGLPLNLDGTEGEPATEARRIARNLSLSLRLPVHLQDERLTTVAASETLRDRETPGQEIASQIDSESAAVILRDYLSTRDARPLASAPPEPDDETVSRETTVEPSADEANRSGPMGTPGNLG